MILRKSNPHQFNSIKLFGYSRTNPYYRAKPFFSNKKQEEFFVASIYAQHLLYNDYAITGIKVCDDDSNKGADVEINLGQDNLKIQITRFTVPGYLQRRNVAKKRCEQMADEVLRFGVVDLPVNVTIHLNEGALMPLYKKKNDALLSEEIARLIKENNVQLKKPGEFINCVSTNPELRNLTPMITLQTIPNGFYSEYFGSGNVFINYDFDNIAFSETDIEAEAKQIFSKKEGGLSDVLIIWAEKFDILYRPELIAKHLQLVFSQSKFKMVIFYSFFNNKDMFLSQEFFTSKIWQSDSFI